MPGDRDPPGKEVIPVSGRDKAANTAQAARGRPNGQLGSGRESERQGGGGKKKASLAQAGEKLKDTANK